MKKGIKFKIILLVTLTLVISNLFVSISMSNISEKFLTNSAQRELAMISENVANQVKAVNDREFYTLKAIAALSFVSDPSLSLEEKTEQLQQIALKTSGQYVAIAIYDKNGNTIRVDGTRANYAEEDYFTAAISGSNFVSSPAEDPADGRVIMFYSVPVYDEAGEICGALVSVIDGGFLSETVKKIELTGGLHPTVLDMTSGFVIGNANTADQTMQGDSMDELDPDSSIARVLGAAISGATGVDTFRDPALKKEMIATYRPVGGECKWAVFAAVPLEIYVRDLHSLSRVITGCTLFAIILSIIISYIVVHSVIKPLVSVKKSINEIASGNADLTKRIEQKTHDEIGEVVAGFNKFTDTLQNIVHNLKNTDSNLTVAGENLTASTQDTSASITQILANIDSMHQQISLQSNSVTETAGAVNEIASNIDSLKRMIENQSAGISQASSAVEEMIGNINSVNSSMNKMASSFEDLTERAQHGSERQLTVNDKIEQIKNQSQSLHEANAAISAIAEQTNLLAMNAAIEAAHAGDAGKGFSVVADEIRVLSETSSQQSRTIGEQLSNIEESITSVVEASLQSSEAFSSVTAKIRETDQLVRQIRAAMEEQTLGSEQINQALHSMNDSSAEVRTASTEMAEGNKQILNEVHNLQNSTDQMLSSMEEMKQGARKINETGVALTEISKRVQESIEQIDSEINLFKV